ncbi:activator-dependent family glycosyltransferase [Streptosporangium sp. NPDC004631]
MRVLFLTVADKSHLHIAAPLAWALQTAGHEVCVVGQSGLADVITPTGLTGVELGEPEEVRLTSRMNEKEPEKDLERGPGREPDVRAAAGDASKQPAGDTPEHRRRRNPRQSDYARDDPGAEFESLVTNLFPVMCPDPFFDDLVDFARAWEPDLVIWDMLTYAGPVVARAGGAAHARLLLATDGVGQLWSAIPEKLRGSGGPLYNWLEPKLERFGCDFGEDMAVGQWTIDPMPWWTYHPAGIHYLPMRHLPFNGPAMAPRWLYEKPARRRVCITLGNSHRDAGRVEAPVGTLIEAVDGLDIEVIATFGAQQVDPLPSLPDNVRTTSFIPLNVLLPSCSAIIHHGGAGTFAGAVEHGVPQLIVPSTWWSEKWYGPVAMANGLQERGAGIYVCDSDRLTADRLRDNLVRVLEEPSFGENAARLGTEVRGMPTPNDIVPTLERLTARHRGSRSRPVGR